MGSKSLLKAGAQVIVLGAAMLISVGAAAAQDPSSARPCGQSTEQYRGPAGELVETAYFWRNCQNVGDYVNIDKVWYPDEQRCIGAGRTEHVGSTSYGGAPVGNVRGVSLIRSC